MVVFKFIGSLLDRASAVVGAFIGSQIPSYMHQYSQRISGHIEELKLFISKVTILASQSGKSLDTYIQKFTSNEDQDFVAHGELLQSSVIRLQKLQAGLEHWVSSPLWKRPFIFFHELNAPIAKATFHDFQPNITLSVEGMCYTAIGFLAGYVFAQCVCSLFKPRKKKKKTLKDIA